MNVKNIAVQTSEAAIRPGDYDFSEIAVPSLHKGMLAQTHYFFPASGRLASSLRLDLKGAEADCKRHFEAVADELSVSHDTLPYGFSESQWWEYCLAPHSYLALEDGVCQVGLNFFNRLLHIDTRKKSAQLVDPDVGDELLSTSNWFDPERQEIWFASWPAEATVRRILNPLDRVLVTIWKLSLPDKRAKQVWHGDFADSLHQLCISPDRRFLILAELGLRLEAPSALPRHASLTRKPPPKGWVVPSSILILDLRTGRHWRLPMTTAAHIEFDPEEPLICYLSGHNIGLIGGKVGIFGPGTIQKFRLKETGPEFLGEFTCPGFYRITTHAVFRHRGESMIAVSGYPDTVFLIDASTMQLYKTIDMHSSEAESVDAGLLPHICGQDCYGIAASGDGQSIVIAGSGFVRTADIETGEIGFKGRIEGYHAGSCFTGHLGGLAFAKTA